MRALYLDTSCLLKVFVPEPETERTLELIAQEERVVVSALTRLEGLVQVYARRAGGGLSSSQASRLARRIDEVLAREPFALLPCPPGMLDHAESQLRGRRSVHCRTLDRLHLAVMQLLHVDRLLTNDDKQAAAGRALGFEVILP